MFFFLFAYAFTNLGWQVNQNRHRAGSVLEDFLDPQLFPGKINPNGAVAEWQTPWT